MAVQVSIYLPQEPAIAGSEPSISAGLFDIELFDNPTKPLERIS